MKKKHHHYFLFIFILFGALLAGVIGVVYYTESGEYIEDLMAEEELNLTLEKTVLETYFKSIISDLKVLTEQNEMEALFQNDSPENRELIALEYLSFAKHKEIYNQVRYLDKMGKEVVRINHDQKNSTRVNDEDLQDKSDRYYFEESFINHPGGIFISPLDLNIERGEIEIPFKPMIRYALSVSDKQGEKQGVVILNYLAQRMLNDLSYISELTPGRIMLLNSDSYWLKSPISEDEWGFMIEDRKDRFFAKDFPEEWELIESQDSGQFHTEKGLFTSLTFYTSEGHEVDTIGTTLTDAIPIHDHTGYYWKLVSHVPSEDIKKELYRISRKLFLMAAFLFLLAAFPSMALANKIINRRISQEELYHSANFDKLTNLPNRAYLKSRLSRTIEDSKRYDRKFALLYLDLDGFKPVNDTYGHDMGDKVLIETARRMERSTRTSDFVTRLGGDEFLIILSEIDSEDKIIRVAQKILDSINAPYLLDEAICQIGTSIGISQFPLDGEKAESLISQADKAMYYAKKNGKNSYQFFHKMSNKI